jgi:DNA-directed RNA polymerase specialized sigma24 family protein
MTHKEIADVMEIPLGTTKSHITPGTKRLREILSAYRDESNANAKQS